MTTITASTTPDARTRTHKWQWTRARAALAQAVRQGTQTASAARRRYRRPALVVSSFTAGVASAWHTFGAGAGLAALCAAGLLLEMLGGEE